MSRRRMRRSRRERQDGIATALLAREIVRSEDFQQVFAELAANLRRELMQELVRQPLRQFGTSLGTEIREGLFGDADLERFSPSVPQLGGMVRDLLAAAEDFF
jgi:hypothetical protein